MTQRSPADPMRDEAMGLTGRIGTRATASDDLRNLLIATDVAAIFLDPNLYVRLFTPAMRDIATLGNADLGCTVARLQDRVGDPDLAADARRCIATLAPVEREIDGPGPRHLIRRLRPYRTSDDRIEGVVVTYADVSGLRLAKDRARQRERQQETVAELGRMALAGVDEDQLFERLIAELQPLLQVRYAKILELDPRGDTLFLRAGCGWRAGLVGHARLGTGPQSMGGFALSQAVPVLVSDFGAETRFSQPDLLRDHGIQCGASVIIGPGDAPWGVLGVHETDPDRCRLTEDDVNFLQAAANTLWLAISQKRDRARIQAQADRMEQLTDALPVRVSVLNTELRYTLLNATHREVGIEPAVSLGRSIEEVVGAPAYETMSPHLQTALTGTPATHEIYTPGPDQSGTYEIVQNVPQRDREGRVNGVISVAVDITERRRLERELERSSAMYRMIGEAVPFGAWAADDAGRLVYLSQSFLDMAGRNFAELAGSGWMKLCEPGCREEIRTAWAHAIETGTRWDREIAVIDRNGETVHILVVGNPITDSAGGTLGWVGLNIDITRRKREEERLETISAELDHRVKNILATVSSVARMTGRHATSLESYRGALEARLSALAEAHQLLAESNWEGMELADLLRLELDPYLQDGRDIRIEGPRVVMPPATAQSLALAFHELATNAAKHGVLGDAGGHLAVSWGYDAGADGPLRFRWTERAAAPLPAQNATGFGSSVLTRIVNRQLDAQTELDIQAEGAIFSMVLPRARLR